MILAVLLAAAAPQTAIDAERAFAADAAREGQWTAFRKWATDDATMFVPLPVKAQEFLKPLKDPPKAIAWSPAASYVSCDGTMAANTGPWKRPDGTAGYFSTIWIRQFTGGWKWAVDGGDALSVSRWPLQTEPKTRRAACGGKPSPAPEIAFRCAAQALERGASADGTLAYLWYVFCGGGSRSLIVWLWNGAGWDEVINDNVALKRRP